MRLTRQTEIAISILVSCARRRRQIDTNLAAAEAGTSKDRAAHVVLQLSKAGWIATRRGRFGGLKLLQPPDHILLGDVVRLTQPRAFALETSNQEAFLGPLLRDLTNSMLDLLDCHSIADLVEAHRDVQCPADMMPPALRLAQGHDGRA
ncbi:Rrf2 family transcriptional regulator (plasmid) [Shinella yambaruensis]|uniref:RrF2 family transcriptional regulator n=1 Tax=Shinella yambaruensis TaxID=415996 RepID=UPI003D7ADAC3